MSKYFVGTEANNQTTFESLTTSEVLDDLQLNTTDSPTFNGLTVGNHIVPDADNEVDLGTTNSKDFRTLYIREIDVFNERLRIDGNGLVGRFRDHGSVGDGFQFVHLGTEILRLGNGTSTTATFAGSVTATSLIKSGGTSSQFLKADGSVDGTPYVSSETYSTPSALLTAIKTVDGSGTGLDADKLDGEEGSYYLNYNNFSNTPTVNDVSETNLLNRLAALDSSDTIYIGDAGDDTTVVVRGTLQVDGSTTTINSNTLSIGDNQIVLNNDVTGTPTQNAGIIVERGTSTNASLIWDETSSEWKAGTVGNEIQIALVNGNYSGLRAQATTKADVGLGNATNESKATMFSSPTFTGTPIAPTAASSTNSTQIATTAFVKAQNYLTSSTETYSTASELLTAIKTVDGSGSGLDADTLDGVSSGSFLRSDANDTVTGEITGSSDPSLSGFFLPQNPEGRHVKAPWFFNDMAYARLKGATVSVTVTGGSSPSNTDIDAMFDASTGFWNLSTSGVTEVVIEITNPPKTMYHGSHMGATFGNPTWRPKDVKLESYYNGQYNELLDVSNQSKEYVTTSYNSGGNAQSKLRWTFSNFNSTSMRIVSLFAYNYNATGMPSLYLANNGGELYGDVTLKSPTGSSQSSYALKLRKTNSSSAAQDGAEIVSGPYSTNTNGGDLILKTSNTSAVLTERMRINGAGNVGIGTNSPNTNLEIAGGADTIARITATTTSARLDLKTNSHHRFWQTIESDGRFRLYNQTTGAEQLTIKSDGNVGIGNAAPSYKLQVTSADANDDVAYIHHDNASQSSGTVLKVRSDAGNSTGYSLLDVQNNSVNALYVRGDGNVGIGTTSPSSLLTVVDSGGTGLEFIPQDANNRNIIFSYKRSASTYKQLVLSANDFSFVTGGVNDRMVIKNDGNVGIGTTSPDSKLHVQGALLLQVNGSDQNSSEDSTTNPSTTTPEFMRIGHTGTYSDGRYTHEWVKLDRVGNLPLYLRQSKGTANSFENIARFGEHSYSTHRFEVFGSIAATGGNSTDWNTAYGWGNHASASYITGNQTITLSGDVSGSGTTSISVSLASDSVSSSEIADNAVTAAAIAANAVGASELNVSGNGGTSQFLRSDGDGTFTWATPTDTNTVYTHPTHAGDDINIDTGALTGATVISDLDFNVTTNSLGHVTDANGTVATRTLTAANLGISAPNAPASASVAIVGNTVEVTFAESTTSNIDAYLVYSSIDGSDYGLISIVPPDDFAASMSIIDNSFDETGTQAYRVYAVKYGILSSATTASVSYTVSSAEPTTMSVVNLNNAYYVQWNPPSSNARFVTAYNVYKHEHATQGSLSRGSASLIYSGMNTNYMYQISGTNNNNFHQFWVETTIA